MARYRKKPVVIEAFQWSHEPPPDWFLADDPNKTLAAMGAPIHIATLEGIMTAHPGDWIIRGIKGEIYPCKPDIFEATYEPEIAPTLHATQLTGGGALHAAGAPHVSTKGTDLDNHPPQPISDAPDFIGAAIDAK